MPLPEEVLELHVCGYETPPTKRRFTDGRRKRPKPGGFDDDWRRFYRRFGIEWTDT
jgi:hypothetical protein